MGRMKEYYYELLESLTDEYLEGYDEDTTENDDLQSGFQEEETNRNTDHK